MPQSLFTNHIPTGMYKLLYTLLISVLFFSACSSVDLSFVNKVKRFEPQWMILSEQMTEIKRNLNITSRRYGEDMEIVSQRISRGEISSSGNVFSMKSQYQKVIDERDEIQKEYDGLYQRFTQKVHDFNSWENMVLNGKVDMGTAEQDFAGFKKDYEQLDKSIDELGEKLTTNIVNHNKILRQLSRTLGLYTNFDIDPGNN